MNPGDLTGVPAGEVVAPALTWWPGHKAPSLDSMPASATTTALGVAPLWRPSSARRWPADSGKLANANPAEPAYDHCVWTMLRHVEAFPINRVRTPSKEGLGLYSPIDGRRVLVPVRPSIAKSHKLRRPYRSTLIPAS